MKKRGISCTNFVWFAQIKSSQKLFSLPICEHNNLKKSCHVPKIPLDVCVPACLGSNYMELVWDLFCSTVVKRLLNSCFGPSSTFLGEAGCTSYTNFGAKYLKYLLVVFRAKQSSQKKNNSEFILFTSFGNSRALHTWYSVPGIQLASTILDTRGNSHPPTTTSVLSVFQEINVSNMATGGECFTVRTWVRVPVTQQDVARLLAE